MHQYMPNYLYLVAYTSVMLSLVINITLSQVGDLVGIIGYLELVGIIFTILNKKDCIARLDTDVWMYRYVI